MVFIMQRRVLALELWPCMLNHNSYLSIGLQDDVLLLCLPLENTSVTHDLIERQNIIQFSL